MLNDDSELDKFVEIEGHRLKISNLEKVLWPKNGYTKADLIRYYTQVGPFMLSFIRNRPLMLYRFPNGIEGEAFVQKNWDYAPDFVRVVEVPSDRASKTMTYVTCENLATLVWLANMAAVEINQFLACYPKVHDHDIVLVDLDPHGPADYRDALEVGYAVHKALEHLNLDHAIKTSGLDGIHFFIPILPKYRIETIRQFVYALGKLVAAVVPKATVSHFRRAGKVYIDFGQNAHKQTITAPYSLRPIRGAPASFPVEPQHLKRARVRPERFNLRTIPKLLKKTEDFQTLLKRRQKLDDAMSKLGIKRS